MNIYHQIDLNYTSNNIPFIKNNVTLQRFYIQENTTDDIFLRYVDEQNTIYISIIANDIYCFVELGEYGKYYCIPEGNLTFSLELRDFMGQDKSYFLENNMATVGKPLTIEIATDYELYKKLGEHVTNVATYSVNMFGILTVIYSRDFGLEPVLGKITYWKTPDPYPNDVADCLSYLKNNVVSKYNVYVLFSAKCSGGGMAYINGACYPPYNKAVAGSLRGYFPSPYPVDYHYDNWDPKVFAHEVAHTLSGIHTHEFNPPIDTCGHNVYNCPATKSTIMSYCHTCTGGMSNIKMSFDSRNIDSIRKYRQC